jgi:DNA invertase Pin-like site-specific DNA recombinase
MAKRDKAQAVGYLRTSSASNVGPDKDSEKRQRAAIEGHAKRAKLEIVAWFNDPAVSGSDPIESRPGFTALLARIAGNGVRTVIVETASRFARDIIVQETGYRLLQRLNVTLIAADAPEGFLDDTPTAKMVRQILGVVSEFEKAMVVAKLKAARDRKRAAEGKCEGRKSYAEANPDLVAAARALAKQGLSLRKISAELLLQGRVTVTGKPYSASSVQSMLREESATQ